MPLHPAQAHWFDAYIPRHQTVYALEAFARSGSVELDRDIVADPIVDTSELRRRLREFERIRTRHAEDLPAADLGPVPVLERPEDAVQESTRVLEHWCAETLRLRSQGERLRRARYNLELLEECVGAMGEQAASLVGFSRAGRLLYKRVFACPADNLQLSPAEARGLAGVFVGARHVFHVVADVTEHQAVLELDAEFRHCQPVEVPDGLPGSRQEQLGVLQARRSVLARETADLQAAEQAHRDDPAVRKALGVAELLAWYLDNSVTLTENRRYCHVTGWTSAASAEELQRALRTAGVQGMIMFHTPPPGRRPSVRGEGGRLGGPFRLFVDMFGTPDTVEVDPTSWLAVIVPLLFGYMFPDVGHGLVLAAGGLLWGRRVPALKVLVPCGLAAAAFGLPFGEVFGVHSVLEPWLWRPLEKPLLTLSVPVFFGAFIILLGMVFGALGARWRGALGEWLRKDAALLALYVGGLASFWHIELGLAALAVAAVWYIWGSASEREGNPLARLLRAAGMLLERVFQLALHTASFIRVGAFALGHAALSHALFEVAYLIDEPVARLAMLVLGHLLVIVLEGLVVFVQTTRLVLFEFFTRFLRAEGRAFRPLSPPARGGRR